jgi:hypothetical protein
VILMLLDGNSGNLVATARSTRVKILLMDYIVSFRFLNKTLEEILNSNYKFIASNWEQLGVIVDSIPNSGFFKWAIPSLIRTGIRAIRIQTTDNKVWGDSAPFLIESKSPSTGTVHRAPPAPEGPFVTVRLEIIDIINNYRKSKGLNPLSFNNCL